MTSIESLQGTRNFLSHWDFLGPHAITPVTFSCLLPHPLCRTWVWCMCLENSLAVLSEVHHHYYAYPSFLTLDLGGLICEPPWEVVEGCHATHPSKMWLARCWVRHLSTLSFSKSSSHSSGVNSIWADQVDTLVSVSLLSHKGKGVASPWGLANRKSWLWWMTFTLLLYSLISYEGHNICNLAYYLIFYFTPMVFHLPFPLKCISFLQHNVSQHQLNCACSFIVIALLSVCLAVGLVLGLSISLFEALLHLFPISRDMMVTCICTNHWEEKVYWEVRSPPKHEVVGWVPCDSRSGTLVGLQKFREMLFPLSLLVRGQFSNHPGQSLVESFHLSIALCMVCSSPAFLNAHCWTELFN